MEFNNIIEKRAVNNGKHSLVLEIAKDEFDKVMSGNIEDTASEIVKTHLINRSDDGRARNIKLNYNKDNDIVKINADVEYLGNQHTEY